MIVSGAGRGGEVSVGGTGMTPCFFFLSFFFFLEGGGCIGGSVLLLVAKISSISDMMHQSE